ncbi:MAG: hypothetical protein KDD22_08035, partial [Bdellovibrionales bacterium]|nr:hypothetical protein [Bdellovibrionales bacterium]
MASFIGGAVRVFFSSRQIQKEVSRILASEDPQFHLQFSSAQLSLSKVWGPRLGLEFNDLIFTPKGICQDSAQLSIHQLYLPVDLFAFLKGKLKFRTLEVDDALLKIDSWNCEYKSTVESSIVAPLAPSPVTKLVVTNTKDKPSKLQKSLEQLSVFFKQRWGQEMQNTSRLLKGLRIDRLRFEDTKTSIEVANFHLSTKNPKEFYLTAKLRSPSLQEKVPVLEAMVLKLRAQPKRLQLQVKEQAREGVLQLNLKMDLEKAQYFGGVGVKHLPAQVVFESLKAVHKEFNSWDWPRQLWINGTFGIRGDLASFQESIIKVQTLLVKGDLADI